MEESKGEWRVIGGVILGIAVVLAVAVVLIWVVFYNYLTSFSGGPSKTGTGSGSASTSAALVWSASTGAAPISPSGAYVSLPPHAW